MRKWEKWPNQLILGSLWKIKNTKRNLKESCVNKILNLLYIEIDQARNAHTTNLANQKRSSNYKFIDILQEIKDRLVAEVTTICFQE